MRKFIPLLLIVPLAFALTVRDIQYSTTGPSPYNGQVVTVSAIVTATGYDGDKYYIGDAGGGPWSGVYVFNWSYSPSVGDWVTITATVDEYYSLTELKNVTAFRVDSTGAPLTAYTTTCSEADTSEALEGVLVHLTDLVVVGGVDSLWEVEDASGRLGIKRKFGYDYSPNIGDTISSLTGMMTYSWYRYILEPRGNSDIVILSDTTTPPETLYTPIASIQANPSAFDEVSVKGVITAAAGKLKDNQLKAYVQDASGMGIQLFSFTLTASMESLMVRGAVVEVTGSVEEYLGTTEISVSEWRVVGSDTLPTPVNVDEIWANGVDWEGTWMVLEGPISDIYSTGSDWNTVVDIGDALITVRIWATTGIDGSRFSVGDNVQVHGVGGVYSSAFQLLPADPEDMDTIPRFIIPPGDKPALNIGEGVLVPTIGEQLPISFSVPLGSRAILRIFDRMGRNVSTLYDGNPVATVSLNWNGSDETGKFIPAGVYLLNLESIGISGKRETVTKTIAIGSVLK